MPLFSHQKDSKSDDAVQRMTELSRSSMIDAINEPTTAPRSSGQGQVLTMSLIINQSEVVLKNLYALHEDIEATAKALLGVTPAESVSNENKNPVPQGTLLQVYNQLAAMQRMIESSRSSMSPLVTFSQAPQ